MKNQAKKPRLKARSSASPVEAAAGPNVVGGGWLVPLIVGVIGFAAFLPALNNGFVNWDDDKLLLENNEFRGFSWGALRWMFTTFHLGPYQPLSWLTYALDYKIWGMDPFGFHLTNLILHALNGVLLFLLARNVFALTVKSGADRGSGFGMTVAAAFAALFFAIHPLRVESVAWATERRDVLSGVFFLACLLCYVHGAAFESERLRQRKLLIAALGLYVLSMLSKAAALTLPVVLLVLDYFPLKRVEAFKGDWFGANSRQIWLEKIPFVFVAVGFGVVALLGQSQSGAMTDLQELPPTARLAQSFYGLAFYLWKTILPTHLAPLYERSTNANPLAWQFLLSAAVVIALSLGAYKVRQRWPALWVAWAVYFLLILPFLGFAQSGTQVVADRYSYLSCMAWAFIAGALYLWGYRRMPNRIFAAVPLGILMALAVLTWRQANRWHDSETLWRHAIEVSPAATPHYNLAVALSAIGKIDEAKNHFEKAIEYYPRYRIAHTNLARLLDAGGDLRRATDHLRIAVDLDPSDASTFNDLGLVLAKQNLLDEAVASLRQAAILKPGVGTTHFNLGNVLVRLGQFAEAAKQYQAATEASPDMVEAYHNLGRVLAAQGQMALAIKNFRKALELRPDFVAARASLSQALAEQNPAR